MERFDNENQHEDNEKSKVEEKRENVPSEENTDNTIKEQGTTSAFSAATQAKAEQEQKENP